VPQLKSGDHPTQNGHSKQLRRRVCILLKRIEFCVRTVSNNPGTAVEHEMTRVAAAEASEYIDEHRFVHEQVKPRTV
jgi:hypothetical protein